MQVKTFEALNMKDAVKAVKNAFGPGAVILKTREKVLEEDPGNKIYEVTAAIADSPKNQGASYQDHESPAFDKIAPKIQSLDIKLTSLLDSVPQKSQIGSLEAGLEELKLLLMESLKSKDGSIFENLPKHLADLSLQLKTMGVDPAYIAQLMSHLQSLPAPENAGKTVPKETAEYFQAEAIRWLIKRVKIAPKLTPMPGSPSIQAFIGPTGTGKTTLVAKLAAHYHKRHKTKVVMVSFDNHRLASEEQLRIYAKVIGAPFEAINSLKELDQVVGRHRDAEVIFLDTAGRSPKNLNLIHDLEPLKSSPLPIDRHLVLSITEKESQLDRSVRSFSTLGLHSLAFTKMDESWSYGEIFNLSVKWSLPLSYFSTGQRVPEDIERASRERVVERIMGL